VANGIVLSGYAPFVAALVCFLLGLTVGKAWERYKLKAGRLVDRRRMPESLHYILGLNFLVTNQLDLAIEELNKAAEHLGDALEIHLLLGSLYREKGQVARAITIHQSLLQRPQLTRLEQSHVLLCLGLDFKRGGFVDRALEAFNEVLKLDPDNHYALVNIEKLHEDQHQWQEAYEVRRVLGHQSLAGGAEDRRSQGILAFLENELGLQALAGGDYAGAVVRFQSAIDLHAGVVPAYLNLGDIYARDEKLAQAVDVWEQVIERAPERAHLTFDRLSTAYVKLGAPERFTQLCRRLIAGNPQDWRARLALARHLESKGDSQAALEQLFEALVHNPHALSLHQAIWQVLSRLDFERSLVQRYVELTRHAVFYMDPHICMRCRYRSTELLWQCPHCHEWNTFVEDRIAPAKEPEEMGV
jgi:lipopolysaccharide biosynthesis regulator YciM